jgi:hypothetical protein
VRRLRAIMMKIDAQRPPEWISNFERSSKLAPRDFRQCHASGY